MCNINKKFPLKLALCRFACPYHACNARQEYNLYVKIVLANLARKNIQKDKLETLLLSKRKLEAAYVVLGIQMDGRKDILGVWIGENESAKFWLSVMNDLKNRGVRDVYVFCVDGLAGLREAINAAFSKSQIQRCIIHQMCTVRLPEHSTIDENHFIINFHIKYKPSKNDFVVAHRGHCVLQG